MDEVCEMELELQSKLLRFLQTGCFQKVGSSVTNRLMYALSVRPADRLKVAAGRFRGSLLPTPCDSTAALTGAW